MNIYDANIEETKRIDYIVEQLTIEEMVALLMHENPEIKRLNIPKYNWWNESLHGVGRAGLATVFPQAIAFGATFDINIIEKVAEVISIEGRAKFNDFKKLEDRGIYKGLTFWAPNINIFRDPRWGRGQETYGEDPILTGLLARAYVRGIQGKNDKYFRAIATPKHFFAHSGPEETRHAFNAIINDYDKYNTYLFAFKEAIDEGAYSIMTAYNRVNNEPCVASENIIQKNLREELKFNGVVVSDCGSVSDTNEYHNVTGNIIESAIKSLKSGLDVECGRSYIHLLDAYDKNIIAKNDLIPNLKRVLQARFRLGLFDKDFSEFENFSYNDVCTKDSLSLSKEVAIDSFVLLKNDNALPIDKSEKILLVGPNANNIDALLGNYHGVPNRPKTVLYSIDNYFENVKYVDGCHLYKKNLYSCGYPEDSFSEVLQVGKNVDTIIFCGGISPCLEGEQGDAFNPLSNSGDRTTIELPKIQKDLIKKLSLLGKKIIFVNFSGSCISFDDTINDVDAILQVWYPGGEGGDAICEVLRGTKNPNGRLPLTFYSKNANLGNFNDYSMENRTYKYTSEPIEFSFGYGLGYCDIEINNYKFDGKVLEINITNHTNLDCKIPIQIYCKHPDAKFNSKLIDIHKIELKNKRNMVFNFNIDLANASEYKNFNEVIDYSKDCELYFTLDAINFHHLRIKGEL